jgi:hypothetical protein
MDTKYYDKITFKFIQNSYENKENVEKLLKMY